MPLDLDLLKSELEKHFEAVSVKWRDHRRQIAIHIGGDDNPLIAQATWEIPEIVQRVVTAMELRAGGD